MKKIMTLLIVVVFIFTSTAVYAGGCGSAKTVDVETPKAAAEIEVA